MLPVTVCIDNATGSPAPVSIAFKRSTTCCFFVLIVVFFTCDVFVIFGEHDAKHITAVIANVVFNAFIFLFLWTQRWRNQAGWKR